MSEKRKSYNQLDNSYAALRLVETGSFAENEKGAMYQTEATAEMLLMTQRLSQPQTAKQSVEASLVRAVLDGEQDRFAKLYEMYAPMVHGILLARVPRNEVDDLVQDIFLHGLKKLHTLRDRAAFGPWIAMIARNRAMDFYRGSRETVGLPSDLAGADRQRVPEAKEVLNMIRRLPDAYRETLVLRDRKSTRLNSSHTVISYAVFCLKKKKKK